MRIHNGRRHKGRASNPISQSREDLEWGLRQDERGLRHTRDCIRVLRAGHKCPDEPYLTLAGALRAEKGAEQAIANKRTALARMGRDENGRSRNRRRNAAPFTKANVARWMNSHASEFQDRRTGEVNATELAEAAADAFDQKQVGGPLDRETHWIWDLAIRYHRADNGRTRRRNADLDALVTIGREVSARLRGRRLPSLDELQMYVERAAAGRYDLTDAEIRDIARAIARRGRRR